MENSIIQWLFLTNAIQVSPENHPFWYTSGKLGPYYINTHYLYGSKADAEDLLKSIEECSLDKLSCPARLFSIMNHQFETNRIFQNVMDLLIEKAKTLDCDFISGGERRDFFFSILTANQLKKPHVSIYKDGAMVLSDPDFKTAVLLKKNALPGQIGLHVADLVTEASSYLRAWIPAVESLGAVMKDSIVVVDRDQGGKEALAQKGVTLHSFAVIQKDLFAAALKNGYINARQYDSILQFIKNPRKFMVAFIETHPDFLAGQLAMGGKTKERAELFIEKEFSKG